MNKEIISTPNAPAAIGPYSQAVKTGLVVLLVDVFDGDVLLASLNGHRGRKSVMQV